MNSSFVYGIHAVLAILKKHPEQLLDLFVQEGRYDHRMQEILNLATSHKISWVAKSKEELNILAQQGKHQGVIAVVESKSRQLNEFELFQWVRNQAEALQILVLDSVQDPHNLGACLRTANAAGVQIVIIPKDKASEVTPLVRKIACGATETMHVISVTNLARTLEELKEMGFWIYGLAGEAQQNLYETKFARNCVMVLGAEGHGLRRLTREKCDFLLSIPMHGTVESLNVSVACGITLFEMVRQNINQFSKIEITRAK